MEKLIKDLLELLPPKLQIEFALYCAKDVESYMRHSSGNKLIDLLEQQLNNPTKENILAILSMRIQIYEDTYNAAESSAFWSSTAYLLSEHYSILTPGLVPDSIAYAAARAAGSSADVQGKQSTIRDAKFNKYYTRLEEMSSFDELEKIIYLKPKGETA